VRQFSTRAMAVTATMTRDARTPSRGCIAKALIVLHENFNPQSVPRMRWAILGGEWAKCCRPRPFGGSRRTIAVRLAAWSRASFSQAQIDRRRPLRCLPTTGRREDMDIRRHVDRPVRRLRSAYRHRNVALPRPRNAISCPRTQQQAMPRLVVELADKAWGKSRFSRNKRP
jgi:hypothetical protein